MKLQPSTNTFRFYFCNLAVFLFLGCSVFQGPGDYREAGEEDSEAWSEEYSPDDFPEKTKLIESIPRPAKKFGTVGPFELAWPVKRPSVSQGYRSFSNPSHEGIDLRGVRGTQILAAHDGWVRYRGQKYRGYGKMIILEHSEEWASLYAHLDKLKVQPGQFIKRGSIIGTMGRTGRASGVHLHFELLHFKQPIDPTEYLQTPLSNFSARERK